MWIRDPHPTDPFSGVTPLEAAGISVDLDHLSRLYNVTFIRNDARPGGVIAVDASSLSPQEMDRLESRFLPGSDYAGHLSVIGTGPGGMAYVDTAAKPRDMNYEHASQNAKLEILAAFGVPESVTGNASGRTFDNAEQEELGFWLHTELGHLELIANAFEKDAGDGMRLRYDTSTVEVLELPAAGVALKPARSGMRASSASTSTASWPASPRTPTLTPGRCGSPRRRHPFRSSQKTRQPSELPAARDRPRPVPRRRARTPHCNPERPRSKVRPHRLSPRPTANQGPTCPSAAQLRPRSRKHAVRCPPLAQERLRPPSRRLTPRAVAFPRKDRPRRP